MSRRKNNQIPHAQADMAGTIISANFVIKKIKGLEGSKFVIFHKND